ncbi:hypothetical protein JCM8097_001300 [Rhodosporidiobolus ruineniae]
MGIDVERFTEEVPDWLICPVCLDVAGDPYTVCTAEHLLCRSCMSDINRDYQQSRTCPTCREPLRPKPSAILKRVIGDYELTCEWDIEGCKWVGTWHDEEKHRKECEFRFVDCRLCWTQIRANTVDQHMAVCESAEVVCSRGGADCGGIKGNGKFQRRETAAHEARCTEFACRFYCGTRTSARNLPAHEQTCFQLQSGHFQLNQQLQQANRRIQGLAAEVASLRAVRCISSSSGPLAHPLIATPQSSQAPATPAPGPTSAPPQVQLPTPPQRAPSGSTSPFDLTSPRKRQSEETQQSGTFDVPKRAKAN